MDSAIPIGMSKNLKRFPFLGMHLYTVNNIVADQMYTKEADDNIFHRVVLGKKKYVLTFFKIIDITCRDYSDIIFILTYYCHYFYYASITT